MRPAKKTCGLCGMFGPFQAQADGVPLHHTEGRDCYHLWTVYHVTPEVYRAQLRAFRQAMHKAVDDLDMVLAKSLLKAEERYKNGNRPLPESWYTR